MKYTAIAISLLATFLLGGCASQQALESARGQAVEVNQSAKELNESVRALTEAVKDQNSAAADAVREVGSKLNDVAAKVDVGSKLLVEAIDKVEKDQSPEGIATAVGEGMQGAAPFLPPNISPWVSAISTMLLTWGAMKRQQIREDRLYDEALNTTVVKNTGDRQ